MGDHYLAIQCISKPERDFTVVPVMWRKTNNHSIYKQVFQSCQLTIEVSACRKQCACLWHPDGRQPRICSNWLTLFVEESSHLVMNTVFTSLIVAFSIFGPSFEADGECSDDSITSYSVTQPFYSRSSIWDIDIEGGLQTCGTNSIPYQSSLVHGSVFDATEYSTGNVDPFKPC